MKQSTKKVLSIILQILILPLLSTLFVTIFQNVIQTDQGVGKQTAIGDNNILIGDNNRITLDTCEPNEILKTIENKSGCDDNLTEFIYKKCGIKLRAYYFDECDTKQAIMVHEKSIEEGGAIYFLVFPLWDKNKEKYYFYDEYFTDNRNSRISIFADKEKNLILNLIDDKGKNYKMYLNTDSWEAEEWALIFLQYFPESEEISFIYKNLQTPSKKAWGKLKAEKLSFKSKYGVAYWGSDINKQNQPKAVIAKVQDISKFIEGDPIIYDFFKNK